jgi:hypothetical protein
MFNPRVGRFMDSGNVDERHYVHCTIEVKIFFALHHFMEIRPLERDSHSQRQS